MQCAGRGPGVWPDGVLAWRLNHVVILHLFLLLSLHILQASQLLLQTCLGQSKRIWIRRIIPQHKGFHVSVSGGSGSAASRGADCYPILGLNQDRSHFFQRLGRVATKKTKERNEFKKQGFQGVHTRVE